MEKRLTLEALLQAERTRREQQKAFTEEADHAISIGRARELAYSPSKVAMRERDHLRECRICRGRIEAFRRFSHPPLLGLFQFLAGVLKKDDRDAVLEHLDHDCTECQPFLRLKLLRDRAGKTIEETERLLSRIERFSIKFPEAALDFAPADLPRRPFSAHLEQNGWILKLEKTDGDELFVGIRKVVKANEAESFRQIHIAVIQPGRLIEAEVQWDEGEFFGAKHYFGGFDDLIRGAGTTSILIVPT